MSEAQVALLVTSFVTLATAVLATLWSVGGRSALARRRIKQELEIAAALPAGPAKQRLEQLADERATLYAYRQSSPGLSPIGWNRLVVLTGGSPLVFFCLLVAWGSTTGPLDVVVTVSLEAVAALFGGCLGFWAGHAIVRRRAKRRVRELEFAREAIQPPR